MASLKKALDEVADKDPVVMWSRIAEMADDATKFEILAKVSVYQLLLLISIMISKVAFKSIADVN